MKEWSVFFCEYTNLNKIYIQQNNSSMACLLNEYNRSEFSSTPIPFGWWRKQKYWTRREANTHCQIGKAGEVWAVKVKEFQEKILFSRERTKFVLPRVVAFSRTFSRSEAKVCMQAAAGMRWIQSVSGWVDITIFPHQCEFQCCLNSR